MFNKKAVSTLSITIALILAGCGGSDSDDTSSSEGSSDAGTSITAIDGYLSAADVYVDRNENTVADTDEYLGLTDDSGVFVIPESDSEYDVIIKAIAGQTSDSDKAGKLTASFDFIAPSSASYITPYSTIAYQNNMSLSEFATQLGVDESILSGDYIKSKADGSDSAKKIHALARSLTLRIGDGADQEELLSDSKDILTQLNDAINNGTDLDDIVITKTDDGFEVTEAPKTVEGYFKGNSFYITSMSEYYHSSDNEGVQKVTFSADTNAVSLGSDSYDIEYSANGFSFLNDDGGSDGMERVIYQSDEFALAIADQGDMTFYSKMDFTTGLDPIHNIVESDFIGKTFYYVMDDSSGDSQGTKPFIVKMEFSGDLIDFNGIEYPGIKISDYNPGTGEFELVDPNFGDDMFWYLTADDSHNSSYHVHIKGVTEDGLLSISPTTMSNNDFMVFYEDSQDLMPRILTENKELAFGLYTQWLDANQ